jgi:short subunit dehydrogenase-like uncharacterized protein
MLGEAAICLAQEGATLPVAGGCWTPSTAFGELLIERLQEHADVSFVLED